MNKGELVTAIAERTDVSKADVERVLRGLFDWYCEHPEERPEGDAPDRVIDYLAGMTDRYAIHVHRKLYSREEL